MYSSYTKASHSYWDDAMLSISFERHLSIFRPPKTNQYLDISLHQANNDVRITWREVHIVRKLTAHFHKTCAIRIYIYDHAITMTQTIYRFCFICKGFMDTKNLKRQANLVGVWLAVLPHCTINSLQTKKMFCNNI